MKSEQHTRPPPDLAHPRQPALGINLWNRFQTLLNLPVNGASLGAFRIAVGLVMALEAWSLCTPSASTNREIPLKAFYTGANVHFHFAYPGFHWLPVLSNHWLEATVAVLAISGLLMAVGFLYRVAAALVFLSWGYLYAIESTRTYWMSYHYLELLTTFLMIWMPAAKRFSIDAWLRARFKSKGGAKAAGRTKQNVSRRSSAMNTGAKGGRERSQESDGYGTVPFWTLLLLRGQLLITYFYAGVAKLNADWLLDAQPVRYYLQQARWVDDYSRLLGPGMVGFLKRFLQSSELAYLISYVGAFFDLSVGFLLLFRRTRIFGMVLMLIFHGTNHFVIFKDIDWFPLLGVLTASIFFEPDWPERVWQWLRHPRLAKPDWKWFVPGAILVPIVGGALGWKVDAAAPVSTRERKGSNKALAAVLVLAWLVWQALMPARQYLIPGDARLTWEGESFSWRLKAEVYRCAPCRLVLEDKGIAAPDASGRTRIDWNNWHGDQVIYRSLNPARVNWSELPEVLVLLEPMIGQRFLYNPFAGRPQGRPEAEARARVGQIWQEIYGHPPPMVLRTGPPTATLSSCAPALRARGYSVATTVQVQQVLEKLLETKQEHDLVSILRQTHPLGLQGGSDPPNPFLVIEDASVALNAGEKTMRVEPRRWKPSSYSHCSRDDADQEVGGQGLVIYVAGEPFALRDHLPQACLFETEDRAQEPAYIWWNYLRELTYAQGMHLSMQPFLLREYARHVAEQWENENGRRPAIRAETFVSLNFRPTQPVVDPQADLASVPLLHLRHNPWIVQLQYPRIPRSGDAMGGAQFQAGPLQNAGAEFLR